MVALAAPFVRRLSPALLLWSANSCLRAYFSAQGVVLPLTLVAAGYTALTPLLNWIFIYRHVLLRIRCVLIDYILHPIFLQCHGVQ